LDDNLMQFQRFRGTLGAGERGIPVRFKARIRKDGEVELDIHAFRITRKTWFIRDHWQSREREVPEFTLTGATETGLRFDTDSLTFSNLGERWSGVHDRHMSKPRGECGKARFFRPLDDPAKTTVLKLHLKGFECFPQLRATCPLGKIHVAGATKLAVADRMTGWISIRAETPPADSAAWRSDAEQLAEHLRRVLSRAASTMLQAPVLEFARGDFYEAEVLSQSAQQAPLMRVFHKLDQQGVLDAGVAAYFNPPIAVNNLFFAIEWFAMTSTYNEVRLVNAMTALENLIDSNLSDDEARIEPEKAFEKTRRALRKTIRSCIEKWPAAQADEAYEQLGEKLRGLNRRSFRRKLSLLAARWQVPLDGLSEMQIRQAITARNAIVHKGYHAGSDEGPDLWDHMTVVRELVVRFLLTALGYRGRYLSHVDGYHDAQFPPESEDGGDGGDVAGGGGAGGPPAAAEEAVPPS
jgi:hypothetical protein